MYDSRLYTSLYNLEYTYQFDKLSCVRTMYFVHVTLAYLVTLCGAMCFVCRLVPGIMWLHAHFGRGYIILMMWLMATSLLLHNTGLPIAVLISFVCVLGGITFGWICIKWHQAQMERRVWQSSGAFTEKSFQEARRAIANECGWLDRLFSAKAAHGMFMFVSFVNILGRLGASDQSGDFVCYTYPVYKPLNSAKYQGYNQSLTPVPVHDPNYAALPWSNSDLYWGLELSMGPLAAAFVVGAMFSYYCASRPSGLFDCTWLTLRPQGSTLVPNFEHGYDE